MIIIIIIYYNDDDGEDNDNYSFLYYLFCLLFIVLFAKNYTNQIKSNYLNSHGEEAQEKPPCL